MVSQSILLTPQSNISIQPTAQKLNQNTVLM